MKVIFEYDDKSEMLNISCTEIPVYEDTSVYNEDCYNKCLTAIYNSIGNLIKK